MNKSLPFILCTFCLLLCYGFAGAQSQQCASGSPRCTPMSGLTAPGFFPNYDSLPCALDGVYYDTVIQFHAPANALGYSITSIAITHIDNIPCGLCWYSSDPNNTFSGNSTGCIRVSGVTFDAPGQYLLQVYADVTVNASGISVTQPNTNITTAANLKYYARVAVPGAPCVLVDTLATGNTAHSGTGTITKPTILGNSSFCSGGNAVLNAGSGYYGYLWSNGAITQSITVTSPGTYTVTVFNNCDSASATKVITSLASPAAAISPANAAVCNGSTVSLTASGGGTYFWNTGSTNSGITVAPTTATTYSVTVTGSNGCTSTASKLVNIGTTPSVSIAPASVSICGGIDTTLTASGSGGLTYTWSTGSTSDTAHVAPQSTTNYKVTATNASGCTAAASRTVNVIAFNPVITANGPTTLCGGGSVTLSVTGTYLSYLWSDNSTGSSITVSNSGSYNCTVTSNTGCSGASNTIVVTSGSSLTPTIVATNGFNICPGGQTILSVDAGFTSYTWSTGANTDSMIATPTSTHTYTITVTTGACTGSASATVNVGNFPSNVSISPSGTANICSGSSVTLNASPGFNTYHWSNGDATDSLQVNTTGYYVVTVTESNSCSGSAATQVTVINPPTPVIVSSGSDTICNGSSVTLSTGAGYLSYLWSTGDTSGAISVVSSGSYSVTVGEYGCTGASTNPVAITVASTPHPGILPASSTLCAGKTATLTADAGFDSYLWSSGETTSTITTDSTGVYAVTVTSNGCSGSSTQPATVFVNPLPVATVAQTGALSGFAILEAGPSNATYSWLVQSTPTGPFTALNATKKADTVVSTSVAAYYSVIATQNGCVDTSAGNVEVFCTGLTDVTSLVSFTVQPNPANDLVSINYELSALTQVHLSIIDMTGRKVAEVVSMSEEKGMHKHYVSVNDFAPGIYLLNFMTDNGSFNTRFVKQ